MCSLQVLTCQLVFSLCVFKGTNGCSLTHVYKHSLTLPSGSAGWWSGCAVTSFNPSLVTPSTSVLCLVSTAHKGGKLSGKYSLTYIAYTGHVPHAYWFNKPITVTATNSTFRLLWTSVVTRCGQTPHTMEPLHTFICVAVRKGLASFPGCPR